MTFTLGRTQVHIGIGTFAAILITAVSATWGFSIAVSTFTAKQDKINEKLNLIIANQRAKDKKDSVQDFRLDTLAIHQVKSDYAQRDLSRQINIPIYSRSQRYVTETRDHTGRIKEHPYTNN